MTIPDGTPNGHVDVVDCAVYFGEHRNRIKAVGHVSMTLEPGSFTALVGPTGCGKSTLLNVIAGFVPQYEGSVSVDGHPVEGPSRDVGLVFQQYALFPWLTARGNVEFALKQFGLSRSERHATAMAALEEVGLANRAKQYPAQLSGGMKQRVALARTLAGKPAVLLMDEPFGALDAQTRLAMHELLMYIWQLHRVTVLFVTHDVGEALLLADRVHVMSAGPGTLIATFDVDAGRPRSVEAVTPSTLKIQTQILALLRDQGALSVKEV